VKSFPVEQDSSKITTVPSPIGGLNAYDNLAAMPATDAIRLDNLVPQPYGCTVRRGYQEYATGMTGAVESISGWVSVSGTPPSKLFAFATGSMWDITAPGAVVPANELLTGLTNDFWQSVFFANSAGPHTLIFNGSDDPIWYSAAGLQRLTAGDGIAAGTWKNVDPANLIQGTIHQRRVWAVEVNSTLGWFLAPDAVYGEANFFDFGALFKRGGYLAALGTWSADTGAGSDDHLVAISSRGEAVVYVGVDPTDASAWRLVGVYFLGEPPRGRRFLTNKGGDLFVLTQNGVVSMATVLTSTQVNVQANDTYSRKVQFLISDLMSDLGDLEGWEILFIPSINLVYINVPSVYQGGNGQLVSNDITQSWCTFSGMNARCWARVDELPFFGTADGRVMRSYIGYKDDVKLDGTGGTNILSFAQQAYTHFNAPAAQKQVGLYRPTFLGSRVVGYASIIKYDYEQQAAPLPTGSGAASPFAFWNQAIWGQDSWSGGLLTQREWNSGSGIGTAVSLALNISSEAESVWVSTDYTYRSGGPL
jgi:hypothetical protein